MANKKAHMKIIYTIKSRNPKIRQKKPIELEVSPEQTIRDLHMRIYESLKEVYGSSNLGYHHSIVIKLPECSNVFYMPFTLRLAEPVFKGRDKYKYIRAITLDWTYSDILHEIESKGREARYNHYLKRKYEKQKECVKMLDTANQGDGRERQLEYLTDKETAYLWDRYGKANKKRLEKTKIKEFRHPDFTDCTIRVVFYHFERRVKPGYGYKMFEHIEPPVRAEEDYEISWIFEKHSQPTQPVVSPAPLSPPVYTKKDPYFFYKIFIATAALISTALVINKLHLPKVLYNNALKIKPIIQSTISSLSI